MHERTDMDAFWTAMDQLSMVLSIELTKERAAAYWDVLYDLPIEAVTFACHHAARYWKPTAEARKPFPVPATLREYAQQYRTEQLQQTAAETRALLLQWNSIPDEVGLAAIRKVLDLLGDKMEMPHPVYQAPSLDDPDTRRAELLAQARLILNQDPEETA